MHQSAPRPRRRGAAKLRPSLLTTSRNLLPADGRRTGRWWANLTFSPTVKKSHLPGMMRETTRPTHTTQSWDGSGAGAPRQAPPKRVPSGVAESILCGHKSSSCCRNCRCRLAASCSIEVNLPGTFASSTHQADAPNHRHAACKAGGPVTCTLATRCHSPLSHCSSVPSSCARKSEMRAAMSTGTSGAAAAPAPAAAASTSL